MFYDCARSIAKQGLNLEDKEDQLMKVFIGNLSLIRSDEAPREEREERLLTVHLRYVAGVIDMIRRVCKDFNIRAVFKSGPTLRSLMTKVKDPEKLLEVIYEARCTCEKVYI